MNKKYVFLTSILMLTILLSSILGVVYIRHLAFLEIEKFYKDELIRLGFINKY